MTKVNKNAFTAAHRGQSIDIRKSLQEPGARAALEKAGIDEAKLVAADGALDGHRDGILDSHEAWALADGFDGADRQGSSVEIDPGGQATPAGKALGALGALLEIKELAAESTERKDFVRDHRNHRIDLAVAGRDPQVRSTLEEAGVAPAEVHRADLDQNGSLSADEAFGLADLRDRDGMGSSLIRSSSNGTPSLAGKALDAMEHLLDRSGPSGASIVAAAEDRIARFGKDYGVPGTWHSPNPRIPGNTRPDKTLFGGTRGSWKCNLYGLDVLYQAGFAVPHYESGWYPIATEIPAFARGKNRFFDMIVEAKLEGVPHDQKRRLVENIMRGCRPGDLLMANHMGADISDGGHTRVVVANNFLENGTIDCAQARQDAAKVLTHSWTDLSGEEALFLLRPSVPRLGPDQRPDR